MARGVRKQEGELLSDANIERVIEALTQDSPVTKKAACEMLNISYSTPRLQRIIEDYKEKKEFRANMRKRFRNTPVDKATASLMVSSYLSGESLADISASTYRSTEVIKRVLMSYNVPIRNKSVDYQHPVFIEEDAQDYVKDDLVYAARYDAPATIVDGHYSDKHEGMVYCIQLHNLRRQTAYQPYWELADLRRVQHELDVKMIDLSTEEVHALINEGLRNQKKQDDMRKKK